MVHDLCATRKNRNSSETEHGKLFIVIIRFQYFPNCADSSIVHVGWTCKVQTVRIIWWLIACSIIDSNTLWDLPSSSQVVNKARFRIWRCLWNNNFLIGNMLWFMYSNHSDTDCADKLFAIIKQICCKLLILWAHNLAHSNSGTSDIFNSVTFVFPVDNWKSKFLGFLKVKLHS